MRGDVRHAHPFTLTDLDRPRLDRLFDRKLANPRPLPRPSYLRYRIETLVGVTGWKMSQYRSTWTEVTTIWFKLIWRPHLLGVLAFEVSIAAEA